MIAFVMLPILGRQPNGIGAVTCKAVYVLCVKAILYGRLEARPIASIKTGHNRSNYPGA